MPTLLPALKRHWPEYLMEAFAIALFMMSACVVTVLLEHPGSPLHQAVNNPLHRRALTGLAMGATAIAIIYSPWGKQSGAHMNPSVTLTFLALGKVVPWDAAFYVVAQITGAVLGVLLSRLLIGFPLEHTAVNYAVTVPGAEGAGVAFLAEIAISALLMTAVLVVSNTRSLSRYTGLVAGCLVALYITVEAPYSGMSMNPARSFASALPAGEWNAFWLYLVAPPAAMLLAGHAYRLKYGAQQVFCAKLHHHNGKRCIFRCKHGELHVQ